MLAEQANATSPLGQIRMRQIRHTARLELICLCPWARGRPHCLDPESGDRMAATIEEEGTGRFGFFDNSGEHRRQ
jgi:hypothetical protein